MNVEFTNFRDQKILLGKEIEEKIKDRHPEITMEQIGETLLNPIEVRESRYKGQSELYYTLGPKKSRFVCVVVKLDTADGSNYIETAYTSSRIKLGEVVYLKPATEKL